jgi:integrase
LTSSDFENASARDQLGRGHIDLARVGRVVTGGDDGEPFQLLGPDGVAVEPVRLWVHYLTIGDHSPRTLRSYCYAALVWFRMLWQLDVAWDRATEAHTAVLVGWLRASPNPQRPRRTATVGNVNVKTGKPSFPDGYSAATINLTLAAVRGIYEFHAHWGRGPVVNPVLASPQRRRALAHRSPLDPKRAHRRDPYRQRSSAKLPRSIPDAQWEEFFSVFRTDRDRALIACYVSSGARAEELLGTEVTDVDWAMQRISVVSKGSRQRRFVPVSPEALQWLAAYLRRSGDPAEGALWRTMRGGDRPLTYSAARRVLQRANDRLGTNWTVHDLRHTAATRMVSSGQLTLPEVQVILDHSDVRTTGRYTLPRVEEVIVKMQEFYTKPASTAPQFSSGYAAEDIAAVFGPSEEGNER